MLIKLFGLLLGAIMAVVLVMPPSSNTAEAGRYRGENGLDKGYVIAYSRFGNGKASGPVRPTRLGPQVRLPSGHWTYCRRSCSETLRVNTVDSRQHIYDGSFLGGSDFGRECGLFGCLDLRLGY